MSFSSIAEKDLDKVFIGQWEITESDDYQSPKAGRPIKSAVVRSRVDYDNSTITLYSKVPCRCGLQSTSMDGSVGIYGKITERAKISDSSIIRLEFLWLKSIPSDKILSLRKEIPGEKDCYILETEAEIDDIVFNGNGEYTFPAKYHINRVCNQLVLVGIEITIPVEKFNYYVHMRNLWYRDYQGAAVITDKP